MSRSSTTPSAGYARSRTEKLRHLHRNGSYFTLRKAYPRIRSLICGWKPILALIALYLFVRGPLLLLSGLDGSTRQQQEALRALVESTTRELAHGVRKFVVNPERSTFTRKTGGKDARGRRRIAGSSPPTLNEVAKQAWKRGAVVQRELLAEMEQLKAHQQQPGGLPNPSGGGSLSGPKWQTWGIRNTSFLGSAGHLSTFSGGSSGVPSEHCRPWLLVTGQQLRTSGGMVQLPCGMALHSALTMIALMPRPKHPRATAKRMLSERLEFVIEVLGLAMVGGEAPTVIYHLSVRPQGDWSGHQVVEQNTCYRARWGDPLRCDGLPSNPLDDLVDGHPRCEKWAVAGSQARKRALGGKARAQQMRDSFGNDATSLIQALDEGDASADGRAGASLGEDAARGVWGASKGGSGTGASGIGGAGAGDAAAGALAGTAGDGLDGLRQEEAVAMAEWPFPVKVGVQFAMTIRAGRHGFHVSVDGSHVTSFPYRSGNPLQEASAVRFSGSLAVHSVFFTGMPTAAPSQLGLLEDSDQLKAVPLKGPKPAVSLFIGILSSSNHFAERMAVRKSWLQHPLIRSGEVAARFFVALHTSVQINLEVYREAEMYGDLIVLPFMDRYELLVVKTVAICRFGIENVTTTYIMKVDDDNFVRLDAVMDEIEHTGFTSGLYMGNVNEFHKPLRDGKWAVTEEEWPETNYPPYANGPGYIITKDIATFVTVMDSRGLLRLFKMEDVSMGMWVVQYGINNTIHYVHNWRFCHQGCIADYITAHYQSPMQMMCLWRKLTRGQLSCC